MSLLVLSPPRGYMVRRRNRLGRLGYRNGRLVVLVLPTPTTGGSVPLLPKASVISFPQARFRNHVVYMHRG